MAKKNLIRLVRGGIGILFVLLLPLVAYGEEEEKKKEEEYTFKDFFATRAAEERVVFHGYADFDFFDAQGLSPGSNPTFDQRVFEPFLGFQVTEEVFAKVIIEIEHASESFAGGDNTAQFTIEQAEIDLALPTLPGANLAFGAILVPFGLENYLHAPSDNRLITRPGLAKDTFITGRTPAILPNTWTNPGIQLTHPIPHVGIVDLYVINGSAALRKTGRDNAPNDPSTGPLSGRSRNKGKSVGGEIQVTGLVSGLNVGVSYIAGEYQDDPDLTGDLLSQRFGVHLLFDRRPLYIQAEYILGKDEAGGGIDRKDLGQKLGTRDRDVTGYYILVGLIPPLLDGRLSLNIRYTDWEDEDGLPDNHAKELSFGLRARLFSNTWLKGEWQANDQDGVNNGDSNLWASQISVLW